jgi:hypothetical protein
MPRSDNIVPLHPGEPVPGVGCLRQQVKIDAYAEHDNGGRHFYQRSGEDPGGGVVAA